MIICRLRSLTAKQSTPRVRESRRVCSCLTILMLKSGRRAGKTNDTGSRCQGCHSAMMELTRPATLRPDKLLIRSIIALGRVNGAVKTTLKLMSPRSKCLLTTKGNKVTRKSNKDLLSTCLHHPRNLRSKPTRVKSKLHKSRLKHHLYLTRISSTQDGPNRATTST